MVKKRKIRQNDRFRRICLIAIEPLPLRPKYHTWSPNGYVCQCRCRCSLIRFPSMSSVILSPRYAGPILYLLSLIRTDYIHVCNAIRIHWRHLTPFQRNSYPLNRVQIFLVQFFSFYAFHTSPVRFNPLLIQQQSLCANKVPISLLEQARARLRCFAPIHTLAGLFHLNISCCHFFLCCILGCRAHTQRNRSCDSIKSKFSIAASHKAISRKLFMQRNQWWRWNRFESIGIACKM